MTKVRVLVAMVIGSLTLAGAAGGFVAGRVVTIGPGDHAKFPDGWFCGASAASVRCRGSDSFPYPELTRTLRGVTVKVHTLSGGFVQVRAFHHQAQLIHLPDGSKYHVPPYTEVVYTFSACSSQRTC